MLKKIIAVLIVCVTIIGIIPMSAFAQNNADQTTTDTFARSSSYADFSEVEVNDSALTANTVYNLTKIGGIITGVDVDYYKVDIPEKSTIKIKASANASFNLDLVDRYENKITGVTVSKAGSILGMVYSGTIERVVEAGTYYIKAVSAWYNAFYTIKVEWTPAPGATANTYATTATTTATTATTTATTTTSATTTTTTTAPNQYNPKVSRIAGESRTQTAVGISQKAFDYAETVVLTSGDAYADALAGVPLAYALDAPILLTDGKTLSAHTSAEIYRLGAENVYILGGTASIGSVIENQLKSSGYAVTRIYGQTRFETAERIAAAMYELGAIKSNTVFFTYGYNYPDALAISPVASMSGSPILYAPSSGSISDGSAAFVDMVNANNAVILGGTNAVGSDVEADIRSLGLMVNRCGGADRYETAINISAKYNALFDGDTVCFATGKNYPDALAGGVFAAKEASPVVLVDNSAKLSIIKDYVRTLSPDTAYVFGGTAVLPDALIADCLSAAESTPTVTTTTTTTAITTTVTPTTQTAETTSTTTSSETASTATTTTTTTAHTTVTTTCTTQSAGNEVYHIYPDTIVYRANSSSKIFHRSDECSSMASPVSLKYSSAAEKGLRPCNNCCANCVYH